MELLFWEILQNLEGDIVALNDALMYLLNQTPSKIIEKFTGLSPKTIHTLKFRMRALFRLGRENVTFMAEQHILNLLLKTPHL